MYSSTQWQGQKARLPPGTSPRQTAHRQKRHTRRTRHTTHINRWYPWETAEASGRLPLISAPWQPYRASECPDPLPETRRRPSPALSAIGPLPLRRHHCCPVRQTQRRVSLPSQAFLSTSGDSLQSKLHRLPPAITASFPDLQNFPVLRSALPPRRRSLPPPAPSDPAREYPALLWQRGPSLSSVQQKPVSSSHSPFNAPAYN